MKIGIITICTGKYNIFFKDFYDSCEKFFLQQHDKKYYVFTDDIIQQKNNIIRIEQKKLGWPYDTMMRFHMFNSIEKQLLENDYLFFLNSNMLPIKEIKENIIPNKKNDFLMGSLHPSFINSTKGKMPYDRNPKCSCYIPYGDGKRYYQGCFNGGESNEFLKMSKILSENIDYDIMNNITPLWHDESQLNWYYKNKNILELPYSYIYPESWDLPLEKIMIQRDKNKYGGHENLRN